MSAWFAWILVIYTFQSIHSLSYTRTYVRCVSFSIGENTINTIILCTGSSISSSPCSASFAVAYITLFRFRNTAAVHTQSNQWRVVVVYVLVLLILLLYFANCTLKLGRFNCCVCVFFLVLLLCVCFYITIRRNNEIIWQLCFPAEGRRQFSCCVV